MSDTLQFELVTPERLALSEQVAMVEVPGEMGDFGVLPGHAPFMSMIRPGVVKVHASDDSTARYFIPAGYAEVNPEGCIVLAEHVQNLADVSAADAEDGLKKAELDVAEAADDAEKAKAEKALLVAQALVEAVAA